MITGFNTDIEHEGVIYHVQTEDKGVSTPLILSLVYNRGTILASKRSPYNDLLLGAFDEKALSERLQKQHKLICAAVRAGRIEDLKRMTRDAATAAKLKKAEAPAKVNQAAETREVSASNNNAISQAFKQEFLPKSNETAPPPVKTELKTEKVSAPIQSFPSPQIPKEKIQIESPVKETSLNLPVTTMAQPANRVETKIAKPKEDSDFPPRVVQEEPIIGAFEIVEDETILSAEAVEIVADFVENRQIVDNKLKIALPDDITFRSGERKTLNVLVYRGGSEAKNGLGGAHIMIKIFGAAFRPLIFHAKTDASGTATVHLQMPQFKGGRASILIKATSGGEETELRRIIERG